LRAISSEICLQRLVAGALRFHGPRPGSGSSNQSAEVQDQQPVEPRAKSTYLSRAIAFRPTAWTVVEASSFLNASKARTADAPSSIKPMMTNEVVGRERWNARSRFEAFEVAGPFDPDPILLSSPQDLPIVPGLGDGLETDARLANDRLEACQRGVVLLGAPCGSRTQTFEAAHRSQFQASRAGPAAAIANRSALAPARLGCVASVSVPRVAARTRPGRRRSSCPPRHRRPGPAGS
jgi:hypothetical protein